MKKSLTMKPKIQFILLLILLNYGLFSCTNEEITPDPKITQEDLKIHLNEDFELQNELCKYGFNYANSNQRTTTLKSENGLEIDPANIYKIINYDSTGYNYTIQITNNDDLNSFSNLILKERHGKYEVNIMKYNFTDSFENFQSFTGSIQRLDFTNQVLDEYLLKNGLYVEEASNQGRIATRGCFVVDVESQCVKWDFSSRYASLGMYPCLEYETVQTITIYPCEEAPSGNDGATDGINYGDGSNISTSGGTSGGGSSSGTGGTTINGSNSSDDLIPEKIIVSVDQIKMELQAAAKWEAENITLSEEFKNNPCLMDILTTMNSLNVGYEAIKRFLSDNNDLKLNFDVKNLNENGKSPNGNAAPIVTYTNGKATALSVTINLNNQTLNRSKLSIARTLLHEMYHAQLMERLFQAGHYDNYQTYADSYSSQDDFTTLWNYYQENANQPSLWSEDFQHNYMAQHYIDDIASGLKELHEQLSSDAFINYENGSYIGNTSAKWSWDSFFIALSWEGLKGTEQYQREVVNKNLEYSFNWYQQEAKREGSSNKCK